MTRLNPHVIAITEVKPKNTRYAIERCELHIEGYELFENLEERGRGVCIYIHRSLKPRRSSLNDITKYEECIWLDISLDGKNRLLLGCIYRSPNSDENNNSKLNQLLRSAQDQRASHILVIGDFNFPSLTWKEDAIDPVNRTAADAQWRVRGMPSSSNMYMNPQDTGSTSTPIHLTSSSPMKREW